MKRLLVGIVLAGATVVAYGQLAGGIMDSQKQGTVAIVGGAIDGTPIGATTRSSGAFTTLNANTSLINTGNGPNAVSGGGASNIQVRQGGTIPASASGANYGFYLDSTASPTAGDSSFAMYLGPTLNKAGSGTHADFATMRIDPPTIGAGAATLTNATTLKINAAPSVGTNQRALWVAAGTTQLDGQVNAKGSATNDSAAAGYVGELITATVASGSAVSLTTATSANVTSISLTAGDWDCTAQVVHNAAATTSITLLQIGISATTATLLTQAGGSGIGTDPLAIWRQAAAVPGGALTTNITDVRVSLAGTTTIFLVANDTFTVSTLTAYGTLRCRRMR